MLIASVRWRARLSAPRLLPPILKVLLVWQSVVARADCGCGRRYVPVGYVLLTAGGDGSSLRNRRALIFVGVLMTSSLARVNWDDFTESVPAFITTVMMPFTFSITEGIALGFMSYCIMKVCTGRWRDLNLCVVVVAALFALKIILVD